MVFGIDYDGTFAADPALFKQMITLIQAAGHTAIIVTGRPNYGPQKREVHWAVPGGVPCLFAGATPKKLYAEQAGYDVDVWMDDNPIMVNFGHEGLQMPGCRERRLPPAV